MQKPSANDQIEHVIRTYGDLLFDLCESLLGSPLNAQLAFRSIIKKIRKESARSAFQDYERAWILHIACDHLRKLSVRYGRRLTPSEQIELDATQVIGHRLKQFDAYFHRLTTEEKLALLLRDKYGIPMREIASATGTPEGTLKIRRQQALRTLEDWLWGGA